MSKKTLLQRCAEMMTRLIRRGKPRLRLQPATSAQPDPMLTERILTRYRETFEILGRS